MNKSITVSDTLTKTKPYNVKEHNKASITISDESS